MHDAKQLRIEEATDKNDERALRDAKTIRIDVASLQKTQVGFAWVDGHMWERWIKTTYGIDVKEGERVIINEEDVSCLHVFPATYLVLTFPTAPPLLGRHRLWRTHPPLPRLHPRNNQQSNRLPTQNRTQIHHRSFHRLLPLNQPLRKHTPIPQLRPSRRLLHRHRSLQQVQKQEIVWPRRIYSLEREGRSAWQLREW